MFTERKGLTEQIGAVEVARARHGQLPACAQRVFSYTTAQLSAERDRLFIQLEKEAESS